MGNQTTARLTAPACRAARALLNWSARDLQLAAHVSPNTVTRIEGGQAVREETLAKVVATFAAHGVEILNGDSPGARLIGRGQ